MYAFVRVRKLNLLILGQSLVYSIPVHSSILSTVLKVSVNVCYLVTIKGKVYTFSECLL